MMIKLVAIIKIVDISAITIYYGNMMITIVGMIKGVAIIKIVGMIKSVAIIKIVGICLFFTL
jgi:hypothetical protein